MLSITGVQKNIFIKGTILINSTLKPVLPNASEAEAQSESSRSCFLLWNLNKLSILLFNNMDLFSLSTG